MEDGKGKYIEVKKDQGKITTSHNHYYTTAIVAVEITTFLSTINLYENKRVRKALNLSDKLLWKARKKFIEFVTHKIHKYCLKRAPRAEPNNSRWVEQYSRQMLVQGWVNVADFGPTLS